MIVEAERTAVHIVITEHVKVEAPENPTDTLEGGKHLSGNVIKTAPDRVTELLFLSILLFDSVSE